MVVVTFEVLPGRRTFEVPRIVYFLFAERLLLVYGSSQEINLSDPKTLFGHSETEHCFPDVFKHCFDVDAEFGRKLC